MGNLHSKSKLISTAKSSWNNSPKQSLNFENRGKAYAKYKEEKINNLRKSYSADITQKPTILEKSKNIAKKLNKVNKSILIA